MQITAIIMAGGKGERFWPKSRGKMPKQFLSLTDDGLTMIQHTVKRLLPLVSIEDIFIVTNQNHVELVEKQLPELPGENILAEPLARNTAPCIAFAAAVIRQKYGNAVMLVLPSDHLIKNNTLFLETLERAAQVAEQGENLVTIGITPNYPETGYGYINFSAAMADEWMDGIYSVKRFVEKPDLEKAKAYLASGEYLWNSGMFVWSVSTIAGCFRRFLPEIYEGMEKMGQAWGKDCFEEIVRSGFKAFPSISVDYGIMEKASHIYTVPGNFGWDDVGSWLALERINPKDERDNVIIGNAVTVGVKDCVIVAGDRLVAAVGVEGLVIVDTPDAVLVCGKDGTQDVKKVIEELKKRGEMELL